MSWLARLLILTAAVPIWNCGGGLGQPTGVGGAGGLGLGGSTGGVAGTKGGTGGAAAGTGGAAGAAGATGGSAGAGGSAGGAGIGSGSGGTAGTGGVAGIGGGSGGTAGAAGTGGAAGAAGGGGAAGGQAGASCSGNALPAHFDCQSRPQSTCAQCLVALGGGDTVCNCLTGSAKVNCQALLTCTSPIFFTCAVSGATPTRCYCSDSTCSKGADGPCAAQFQAVAGTSDPTAVIEQLSDPSTTVARVSQEATRLGLTAGCGMYCGCL